MADLDPTETSEVTIAGQLGINKLTVEPNGSINVNDTTAQLAANDKFYRVVIEFPTSNQNEDDMLLLRNPIGSGKRMSLLSVAVGYSDKTSVSGEFRSYEDPTITANGTVVTITPARIGGSPPASGLEAYSSPNISARGVQISAIQVSGGTNSSGSKFIPINGSTIMDPGGDWLMTTQSGQNNQTVLLVLSWVEEDV